MQGVILAIAKARQTFDRDGSEAGLIKVFLGFFCLFLKDFIYLFLEKGEGRERSINEWLRLSHPLLGIWPATQACALTGN